MTPRARRLWLGGTALAVMAAAATYALTRPDDEPWMVWAGDDGTGTTIVSDRMGGRPLGTTWTLAGCFRVHHARVPWPWPLSLLAARRTTLYEPDSVVIKDENGRDWRPVFRDLPDVVPEPDPALAGTWRIVRSRRPVTAIEIDLRPDGTVGRYEPRTAWAVRGDALVFLGRDGGPSRDRGDTCTLAPDRRSFEGWDVTGERVP